MTDSGHDIALSAADHRSLVNLLQRGDPHRFRAVVLTTRTPAQQERLMRWLEEQGQRLERPALRIDLQALPGVNLWHELGQILPNPRPPLLLLFGLERDGKDPEPDRQLLRQLNVQRDLFVRDIAAMWVLFMYPHTSLRMRMESPDFSDYITLWVDAPSEEPPVELTLPLSPSQPTPSPDLAELGAPWERRARAALSRYDLSAARDILESARIEAPKVADDARWRLLQGVLLLRGDAPAQGQALVQGAHAALLGSSDPLDQERAKEAERELAQAPAPRSVGPVLFRSHLALAAQTYVDGLSLPSEHRSLLTPALRLLAEVDQGASWQPDLQLSAIQGQLDNLAQTATGRPPALDLAFRALIGLLRISSAWGPNEGEAQAQALEELRTLAQQDPKLTPLLAWACVCRAARLLQTQQTMAELNVVTSLLPNPEQLPDDDPLAAEILTCWGDLAEHQGHFEDAERRWREAVTRFEHVGDALAIAFVVLRIARHKLSHGHTEEAHKVLDQVQPLLAQHQDINSRAHLQLVLADSMLAAGQVDEALSVLEELRAPLQASGHVLAYADVLDRIANIHYLRGEYTTARHIRETDQIPLLQRSARMGSLAYANLALARIFHKQGEVDRALTLLQKEVGPSFRQLGDVQGSVLADQILADILVQRGDPATAQTLLDQHITQFDAQHDPWGFVHLQSRRAELLALQGQREAALGLLQDHVLPISRSLDMPAVHAVVLGNLARLYLWRQELDNALHIYRDELLPIHQSTGNRREQGITFSQIARILTQKGQVAEAERILQKQALPILQAIGDARSFAIALGDLALNRRAQGKPEDSLRLLREQVLPVFEGLGDILEICRVWSQIAQDLVALGRFADAITAMQDKSLPGLQQLSAQPELLRAQAQLAQLYMQRDKGPDRLHARRLLRLAQQSATLLGLEADLASLAQLQRWYGFA